MFCVETLEPRPLLAGPANKGAGPARKGLGSNVFWDGGEGRQLASARIIIVILDDESIPNAQITVIKIQFRICAKI